jgi:hypothetical protein
MFCIIGLERIAAISRDLGGYGIDAIPCLWILIVSK